MVAGTKESFLKRKELVARISLSYPTIWRMERKGMFPARRQISPGRVGWLESEIEQWLADRCKVMAASV